MSMPFSHVPKQIFCRIWHEWYGYHSCHTGNQKDTDKLEVMVENWWRFIHSKLSYAIFKEINLKTTM